MTDIPQGFFYRDSDHSYYLNGKRMTGCTTILGVLNKPALVGWAAKMATEYIALVGKPIYELEGVKLEDTYLVTGKQIEEAKTAYAKKRDEGAQKGTDTHALVESWIKWVILRADGDPSEVLPIPVHDEKIQDFVDWARKENIKFIASEERLYSEKYWLAGTADFIFEKDGKRYLGDLKTYKKIWDRTPFYQCSGYALMAEEMGQPKFDGYCIFNLPKERAFKEADDVMWSFDVEGDTEAFLACVTLYRQNENFTKNYAKKSK